jgi:ferredoxin--NADP+ reductase
MVTDTMNAVVALRIEISPWLIILRVVPDGWHLPEFKPGQFAVLGLPGAAARHVLADPESTPPEPGKMLRRAYSIASTSVAHEYLEFYVALVGSGLLTPRLFALNMGDRVWLSPKITGAFTLEQVPEGMNVVMIATGTGLAPYISMLGTYLTQGNYGRFAILHGARHSWDLGYRSELLTLQHLYPGFTYIPTISRPANEPVPWTGQTGYVQDLWKRGVLAEAWNCTPMPSNTHVLLCGSPGMIDDVSKMLATEGFREHTRKQPGEVHLERFW